MSSNLKVLLMLFSLILLSSCKQENISEIGRELITQNINILLDSIERFDTSKMPVADKFKDIKIEQIKIGLIDSVTVETLNLNEIKNKLSFLIAKNDLINFKSNYKINIVKVNNYDGNLLFVSFSNFQIDKNKASIDVKKVIGISMTKDRYFFKNENKEWVFKSKKNIGIG
jgi:hypothetical protein